jgi:electron transfer flavoprotein alpha subunit
MPKEIWIFVEQQQGKIREVSLELLCQGRKMADSLGLELGAVIAGENIHHLASQAAAFGANRVYLLDDPKLRNFTNGAYTSALSSLIHNGKPEVLLLGNTAVGKDLAPKLTQRLEVGLISDCVDAKIDPEKLFVWKRPIYAGKAFAYVQSRESPILVTIRPNSFPVEQPDTLRQYEVLDTPVTISPTDLEVMIKETALAVSKRPDLSEANIVVSGGRGMKGPENFKMLEDLADVLGAAIGASRAAVDSGWCDFKMQVGQTGKTVSPTLYIACGISGAMQHVAGMGSSKVIVAINNNPNANIFKIADYGIVGDLLEIVPLLTKEFKRIIH